MNPPTAPNLRQLLPATGSRPSRPPSPTRAHRTVACEPCRVKKTKCNREQPACGRCQSLDLHCEYAIGPSDTSRKAALQRRLVEVETERDSLRDLLKLIQTQPDDEAAEIFRRLRVDRDPLGTLQAIEQAKILLPNPDPMSQFQGYPQIETLDAASARLSPLKLRARPWTTVVGDGIVSALISKFFIWDGAYMLPFIDRTCFVRDMKTGNVRSQFCSPFLVSAICTLQHYSDDVRKINTVTGQNLQESFFLEAQQYFQLENDRASLTTAQGLLIMFMASAFLSRDGAAPIYRSLGYDMIDRLMIEEKIASTTDEQEKKAYSTAVWGIYCLENIIANLHNKRPERRVPNIPRLFHRRNATLGDVLENVDILGQPYTISSYRPAFTPGVLNAACDLAIVQNSIINYNLDVQELIIDDDLSTRREHIHRDVIALFLLRPLDPDVCLMGETTSQILRVAHCQRIISLVETHFRDQLAGDYTIFFLAGLFHVCLTLIPSLASSVSSDLFTRAAMLLHRTVVDLPGMRQILRGVQAVVWGMNKSLPQGAKASFEGLKAPADSVEVNREWGFPQLEYLQSEPGAAVKDLRGIQGSLGRLIAMWEEA
ncbi:uncharacterized protein EKO05_0002399 [Ascochyta rabiei]|uniref:uncharacterized protein n=1 Tax=Didymella rabiei TaxID=5454 RepID=UPI0022060B00|nr:uncharacterized protein EKO05_0002399 [Ascochyta rabiei]UPX11811.1 hypothetical protein EKO05_0002399 [Ascochyta rabiei]